MPTKKKQTKKTQTTSVKVERPAESSKTKTTNMNFFDKVQQDITNNQSRLNLLLGVLIILVIAVLLFNYFKRPESSIGSADQTQQTQSGTQYTIQSGDTLFLIAQKFYGDGYQFNKIADANGISDPNSITVGQNIIIPAADETPSPSASAMSSASPTASPSDMASPSPSATVAPTMTPAPTATPAPQSTMSNDQTAWGTKISTKTYTVQPGDWLSTIAGRTYGDIYAFDKIAKANNISNPNEIEVGTVLQLP
jgi:nucleoid-associated protein YgaU